MLHLSLPYIFNGNAEVAHRQLQCYETLIEMWLQLSYSNIVLQTQLVIHPLQYHGIRSVPELHQDHTGLYLFLGKAPNSGLGEQKSDSKPNCKVIEKSALSDGQKCICGSNPLRCKLHFRNFQAVHKQQRVTKQYLHK